VRNATVLYWYAILEILYSRLKTCCRDSRIWVE